MSSPVAKELKRVLSARSLSLGTAAAKTGLTHQHLHYLTTGKRRVTANVADRLERAGLGSAMDWLCLQAQSDLKHENEGA